MTSGIIKRVLEECNMSSYRFRIGAVVFKGKRIISSGHNAIRSSTISPKYRFWPNSLHAEQAALLGINWSTLRGCSILVIKISKTQGLMSNAKPCRICMNLLDYVGIKNIYYSNEQGEIVKL